METGKTSERAGGIDLFDRPQWSPVVETGKTTMTPSEMVMSTLASMEPGRGDREDLEYVSRAYDSEASMEPGRGDREDAVTEPSRVADQGRPQWSPVVETGKTSTGH